MPRGIFTGAEPFFDEVIGIGDPLLGSTLTGLVFFADALNDSGQLAFFYFLADGRAGIARADPLISVPEPGSFALLGIGKRTAIRAKSIDLMARRVYAAGQLVTERISYVASAIPLSHLAQEKYE